MAKIAIYPGSFDPVTTGHMDVIRRAAALFDHLIVCVLHNPAKQGCFPIDRRLNMLERCCQGMENVEIRTSEGLTVAFAASVNACAMIRGLRSEKDYLVEQELAQINAKIAPQVETVFLLSRPEHQCISSSAVRELASFGGDLTGFVPEQILEQVADHFSR